LKGTKFPGLGIWLNCMRQTRRSFIELIGFKARPNLIKVIKRWITAWTTIRSYG